MSMCFIVSPSLLFLSCLCGSVFFMVFLFFFFKQKTAYEIKECDWSSDVCSSDLEKRLFQGVVFEEGRFIFSHCV